MPTSSHNENIPSLTASYTGSAGEQQTFSHATTTLPRGYSERDRSAGTTIHTNPEPTNEDKRSYNVEDKTAYLASLRTAVVKMQGDINAFLTAKMEEDNRADPAAAAAARKEEDNYGEEGVDEE